jgi:hypothetical protein
VEEKKCIHCKEVKPVSEFHFRKDTNKPCGECKQCKLDRSKKYYRENTAQHRKTVTRRYETFGRFARYHLTLEQYEETLKKQGGKCALCRTNNPGGKRQKWHIDHKPNPLNTSRNTWRLSKSSDFRGLLCHHCNMSLSHYESLLIRVGEEKVKQYLLTKHFLE